MVPSPCKHCPHHCPRSRARAINLLAVLVLAASCGPATTDLPEDALGVYEGQWQDGSAGQADVLEWYDDKYHLTFDAPNRPICSTTVSVYKRDGGWTLRHDGCSDPFDARIERTASGYTLRWSGDLTSFDGSR